MRDASTASRPRFCTPSSRSPRAISLALILMVLPFVKVGGGGKQGAGSGSGEQEQDSESVSCSPLPVPRSLPFTLRRWSFRRPGSALRRRRRSIRSGR